MTQTKYLIVLVFLKDSQSTSTVTSLVGKGRTEDFHEAENYVGKNRDDSVNKSRRRSREAPPICQRLAAPRWNVNGFESWTS